MDTVRQSVCDTRIELERLGTSTSAAAIAADGRLSAAEAGVERVGNELEQQAEWLRAASATERQALQTQLDALQRHVIELEAALGVERQRRAAWTAGRGLRARVRRWLTPT
jgi:hypothetical protein